MKQEDIEQIEALCRKYGKEDVLKYINNLKISSFDSGFDNDENNYFDTFSKENQDEKDGKSKIEDFKNLIMDMRKHPNNYEVGAEMEYLKEKILPSTSNGTELLNKAEEFSRGFSIDQWNEMIDGAEDFQTDTGIYIDWVDEVERNMPLQDFLYIEDTKWQDNNFISYIINHADINECIYKKYGYYVNVYSIGYFIYVIEGNTADEGNKRFVILNVGDQYI